MSPVTRTLIRLWPGLVLALLLTVALLGASGCGDSASQAEVVVSPPSTSSEATGTADASLTPLERGRLRREVLAEARAALDAWRTADMDAMKKYFSPDLVKKVQELEATDQAQGKRHVRAHEELFLDVIEMNQDGSQASVEYRFNDNSYDVNLAGARLSEPTGEEGTFQMTWQQTDGELAAPPGDRRDRRPEVAGGWTGESWQEQQVARIAADNEASAERPQRDWAAALRKLALALTVVVVFAFLLSLTVNGLWSMARESSAVGVEGEESAEALGIELDKPAIDMVPKNVLTYETLGRQAIPGQGDRAAEAIYVTLNMNFEAMVSINVYARVEGFGSRAAAEGRVREMMFPYTSKSADRQLETGSIVKTGYQTGEGAYAMAWANGPYAVLVKGAFATAIPVEKRDFLETQTLPVAEAVDQFQRTGRSYGNSGRPAQAGAAEATGSVLPEVEGATPPDTGQ